jgi:hypothetical protein
LRRFEENDVEQFAGFDSGTLFQKRKQHETASIESVVGDSAIGIPPADVPPKFITWYVTNRDLAFGLLVLVCMTSFSLETKKIQHQNLFQGLQCEALISHEPVCIRGLPVVRAMRG